MRTLIGVPKVPMKMDVAFNPPRQMLPPKQLALSSPESLSDVPSPFADKILALKREVVNVAVSASIAPARLYWPPPAIKLIPLPVAISDALPITIDAGSLPKSNGRLIDPALMLIELCVSDPATPSADVKIAPDAI